MTILRVTLAKHYCLNGESWRQEVVIEHDKLERGLVACALERLISSPDHVFVSEEERTALVLHLKVAVVVGTAVGEPAHLAHHTLCEEHMAIL